MAMCDYYLCDACGHKCFYDAGIAEYDDQNRYLMNGSAVDIAAICEACTKTHQCIVVPRLLTGADTPQELGCNIDMTDVDRLRDWARNIDDGGILLTAWASPSFLVNRLRELADRVEQEVKDVGALRKLLGYHGTPSLSEAGASAQSEAPEKKSPTPETK